jgi:hyperosmotically inducible protein
MTVKAPDLRRVTRRRTSQRQPRTKPAAVVAVAAAFGALLEYFLDPGAGRRRRHTARDRVLAKLRRGERRAVTRARRAESRTVGMFRRTLNARHAPKPPADDVALAHKVESELFRRARVPKGQIDINAEEGTVFLRGVVESDEDIARLADVAERIPGVRGVENLLHLPGTPAPASRPKLVRDRAG